MFKISFQRQVLTGFTVSLLLVFTINYLAYTNINHLNEKAKLVAHTQEVIAAANELYVTVLNAESGQRGYMATQEERYLDNYNKALADYKRLNSRLPGLVSDNPVQTKRVDSLIELVDARISELEHVITLSRDRGFDEARKRMLTDRGKMIMSQIRGHISKIISTEEELLSIREAEANESDSLTRAIIITGGILVLCILIMMFFYITRTFRRQREAEQKVMEYNAELEKISAENKFRNWLLTGSSNLNEQLRGENEIDVLSNNLIKSLAHYLKARIGLLYIYEPEKESLVLTGTFACDPSEVHNKNIALGEGVTGQAALDRNIVLYKNVPEDYMKVRSGLGESLPRNLIISPIYTDNKLKAVLELGFSEEADDSYMELLMLVNENIAIAIQASQARKRMKELFEQTQQQAEELQAQQEELRQTNEELSSQTQLLMASEEELRVQQEELQQSNTELEEKAMLLEEKNRTIEDAQKSVMQKAEELEQTNKYKSEFMANMSHELRTPLNSILILAKLLSENKNNGLTPDEVKYASVIYNSGTDLLTLINDILDLSKIESGKLDLHFESTPVEEIGDDLTSMFSQLAEQKKISFRVEIDQEVPEYVNTDKQRIEQVLRNLLSNAFKFTPQKGSITLRFSHRDNQLQIDVQDTGIGIAPEKQRLIFEAFQQADGTTSRKYGGTGLGLSISRELAGLLGGEIRLESEPGKGSTFSLIIPYEFAVSTIKHENTVPKSDKKEISRPKLIKTDPSNNKLLIVEDDFNFAKILKDYATQKGFDVILAHDGREALQKAKEFKPRAILLDIMLPLVDGWGVLKQIKADPELNFIPVHIMSATERNPDMLYDHGADSFLAKPVNTVKLEQLFSSIEQFSEIPDKKILVVEDNEAESKQLRQILNNQGFEAIQAYSGIEALQLLKEKKFDSIILDLKLPDMDGLDLLKKIKADERLRTLPVIINTAMDIPSHIQNEIMQYSNAYIIKNNRSNERLMDEIKLFINKVKQSESRSAGISIKNTALTSEQFDISRVLKNKKVLLVDDDMRNIFALSTILQQQQMVVEIANNGLEAVEKVKAGGEYDIVLMDIMMPEMDGYEATSKIRLIETHKDIPIIALTAKAMKNDREKCIEAGANDYITKPVDLDKLLSLMRVWLSK